MVYEVLVEVRLRAGIANPEGATIERALPTLGFDEVHHVRTGKAIRFSMDADGESSARSLVDDLCSKFLINPVIEEAVVTFERADAGTP